MNTVKTINPTTEEGIKTYNFISDTEVEEIISDSNTAFDSWKRTSFEERAKKMNEVARILRGNKREYAEVMATEMGKPYTDGEGEIEKCAWVCEYYAEHAAKFLSDEYIETDATSSYIAYRPLGVVLAIMPWNFPFWQVFRFAAPSIMAGNTAILKHAPNVFRCAELIEEVFLNGGFPEGVFKNLIIDTGAVKKVINHSAIKAVTLTGSTRAGKSVAKKSGSVLKKTVLELGGSDPYIILEDSDLSLAVEKCVTSRLINNGQSCISAKRFIATAKIHDEFVTMMMEKMRDYTIGEPYNKDTQLGPMAREDLLENLDKQVKKSIEKGAKCILGGEPLNRKGYFYPPTILTDVKKGMPAYEEELFGPVAAIIKVKDEKEAIAVANDSVYGLGSAIFSKNVKRAEEIAKNELEAGSCVVNDFVRSDPRLPFGGIKESGYGRELSHLGIREFVNIKTVYVG